MGKTKKKQRYYWNQMALNDLVDIFGVTKYYIRQCLKGERKSLTSDRIKKEYKRLEKEYQKTSQKNKQL